MPPARDNAAESLRSRRPFARSRFFLLSSGPHAQTTSQPCVLAVGKRQAKAAVRRNLIKRLGREWLKKHEGQVPHPSTLVFRQGPEVAACCSASSKRLKALIRDDLHLLGETLQATSRAMPPSGIHPA